MWLLSDLIILPSVGTLMDYLFVFYKKAFCLKHTSILFGMLTFTVDCIANLIVRSLTDADQRLLCRKSVVYSSSKL